MVDDNSLDRSTDHPVHKFKQYRKTLGQVAAAAKLIVYARVNDDDAKRAYESSDDAYRVLKAPRSSA